MSDGTQETNFLTAETILGTDDIVIERLEIPEWKGHIFIKSMTGNQRDEWETHIVRSRDAAHRAVLLRGRLACISACHEDGKPLFTMAQITEVGKKNARALNRIFDASTKLNGLTKEEIESLEKNSDAAPSEDSGSS